MTPVIFCVLVIKATCGGGADCKEGEHLGREFPSDVAPAALGCAMRNLGNKNLESELKFLSVHADPVA